MELFDEAYLNQVVKPVDNYFENCLSFAEGYILAATTPFSSEQIIEAYKECDLPQVKEARVWGAVIKKLKKSGLIEFDSFGIYHGKQGHGKPINIWRKKN